MADHLKHPHGDAKTEANDEFLQLFFRHQMQLYGYIVSLIPKVADAQDVFQETAAVMWKKFETFESGTNFLAWGTRIAYLNVLHYYRRLNSQKVVFDSDAMENISSRMMKKMDQVPDRIEALQQCMDTLPTDQKYLVKLRYEKALSAKEVASQIGKTLSSVHKALSRIHLRLQRCVQLRIAGWEVGHE